MKRNKGDAADFEPSEENDASDNDRQPAWLRDAAASPFERPPRRSSAYSGSEHRGDRKEGRGLRSGAYGHDRAHGERDSRRGNYSPREEGRLMPIDADVLAYFPDPGAINQALRALIPIIDSRGARGERGERGARRSSSPRYGERSEHHEGGYRAKPRYSEGRAERSFPPDRTPFARKRPRSL